MSAFVFALQFLTILPIKLAKPPEAKDFAKAAAFFPVVGLFLAALLMGADFLLMKIFPAPLTNLFLVILLAILTGALHLDGLADTFDALASGKNREKMLAIMHESSIGVMGTLSLISVFATKVVVLSYLPRDKKSLCLTAMLVCARWSMTAVVSFFKYARPEGKAKEFTQNVSKKAFVVSSCLTAAVSCTLFGIWGLAPLAISAMIAFAFSYFASKKLGGITGDVLGAVNEINECSLLISLYLLSHLGGII